MRVRRVVGALVAGAVIAGVLSAPAGDVAASVAESQTAPRVNADVHGPRNPVPRAGVDSSVVAGQVLRQIGSDGFASRLAGVTTALKYGGAVVVDGDRMATPAIGRTGNWRMTTMERANLALNPTSAGLSGSQVADLFTQTKVIDRVRLKKASAANVLAEAMRAWILAARKKPKAVDAFAPLFIRADVLSRSGVDLAAPNANIQGADFSQLDLILIAMSLDRTIPVSKRRAAPSSRSSAPSADNFVPNPQKCFDATRNWLNENLPTAESILSGAFNKWTGELIEHLIVGLGDPQLGLGTIKPDTAEFANKVGNAMTGLGILLKLQKVALLYTGIGVDVASSMTEVDVPEGGMFSHGWVDFTATVGLNKATSDDYTQATGSYLGSLGFRDFRKKISDCADLFGFPDPFIASSDLAEDLEKFRINWKLNINRYVQWDLYGERTTWFAPVTPVRGIGELARVSPTRAAHTMYARLDGQADWSLNPEMYRQASTWAQATARLDFSQPPDIGSLAKLINPLGGAIDLTADAILGFVESLAQPSASAQVKVTYMVPKCSGKARALWRLAGEVCTGRTLSLGVTGQGRVLSSPGGLNCTRLCDADFSKGEVVTLTARPASGWRLSSWVGVPARCMNEPTCTVLMNDDVTLEAVFAKIPTARVQVTVVGQGVVQSGFYLNCGAGVSLCSYSATDAGEQLTIVATPTIGYRFAGWSGACQGTGECALTTTGVVQSLTATFVEAPLPFRRVSTTADGSQLLDHATDGAFSPDGTKVYFSSKAVVVPGDGNGASDVFERNLITGAVTRISVGLNGQERDSFEGWSRDVSLAGISPDGTKVLMWGPPRTDWINALDPTGQPGLWLKDLVSGSLTPLPDPLANLNPGYEGWATSGAVASDAVYYAVEGFHCRDGFANVKGCTQLIRHELQSGTWSRIDTSAFTDQNRFGLLVQGVVGNGRYVVLHGYDGTVYRALILDSATGAISELRENSALVRLDLGILNPFSDWVVAASAANPSDHMLVNVATGAVRDYGDSASLKFDVAVLADTYVLRLQSQTGTSGDGLQFLTDLATGATASVPGVPRLHPDDSYVVPSPDGQYVLLSSLATDLVAGDTNGKSDLFVVRISDLLALTAAAP